MHNPRTRKLSVSWKRIGCRNQGFPEKELPRFRKEASILRTETFGPHSEQLGHNLWVHDKKRSGDTRTKTGHGRHRNARRRTEIERWNARELTTPLVLPQDTDSETSHK